MLPKHFRLSVDEVYPQVGIYSVRVSPDADHLAFVFRRSRILTLETEHAQERANGVPKRSLRDSSTAEVCLLALEDGSIRPLLSTGAQFGALSYGPKTAAGRELLIYDHSTRVIEVVSTRGRDRRSIFTRRLILPRHELGDDDLARPRWSPDGKSILAAVHRGGNCQLIAISADGSGWRRLLEIEGIISSWDWSSDGQHIVVITRHQDALTGDVLIVDAVSDSQEPIRIASEASFEYRKPVARWSPNCTIILRSNRSGWSKLWIVNPMDQTAEPLTYGDWDDYAFHINTDGRIVYASRAEQPGTGDDLWILHPTDRRPERLTCHPGVNVPLGWAGDTVVYWHTSGTEWGEIWRIDIGEQSGRPLTTSLPIELSAKVASPLEVSVPGPDGDLSGLVYLPAYHSDGQQHPAIVWVHGGPTRISRLTWDPFCRWLANEGFVVMTLNYRGSVGHGVPHMEAVAGPGLGSSDLDDVLASGNYVRQLPEVDLTRGIGIGGYSYGGYLALMAVTQQPRDFSCAFAGMAVSDWVVAQAETNLRYYDRWLIGGWVYEKSDHAADRSPISHVQNLRVPLLITHGEDDATVPARQMKRFVEKARALGKEVQAKFYPHEGHTLRIRANQQDELNRISSFFRRYLQSWNFVDNPSLAQSHE